MKYCYQKFMRAKHNFRLGQVQLEHLQCFENLNVKMLKYFKKWLTIIKLTPLKRTLAFLP